MAGEENRVVLHGIRVSLFSERVELALKVKGIEYKFVEEDLTNNSEALLWYSPVHKKVPVLAHNGKSMAESLVIIEYIDETWKESPRLLPQDPYERAKVRFWAGFVPQQLFETMFSVPKTDIEAQERAVEEVQEKLKMFEEGIKGCYPGGSPFINGNNMGLLDIVVCSTLGAHKAQEEALSVAFLDQEKYPRVTSWEKALTELPSVKEAMRPHEKLVTILKLKRASSKIRNSLMLR